ncbi:hypothetical protein F5144DRAFT_125067 [Chaetomium tenue]|uniref:Uncharacterized protein n=1 Tax=Chaetomium tenue TaxID=1854479 RepID=A0ACB7PLE8_9PEZI|nr:hypothetical protein F5144DRAFT_125067 [Chaetomium globosum]
MIIAHLRARLAARLIIFRLLLVPLGSRLGTDTRASAGPASALPAGPIDVRQPSPGHVPAIRTVQPLLFSGYCGRRPSNLSIARHLT